MIQVEKIEGDDFKVRVEDKDYRVTLDDNYYDELDGKMSKESLIRESFEFLLEREPKESILSKFNLKEINNYFPEFEEEIKNG